MDSIKIDVIIPSFRLSSDFLLRLSKLDIPDYVKMTYYVIIDNPTITIPNIRENFSMNIQFIKNKTNLGAGQTRNVGLNNAEGDYILFLDDDITPDKDLIIEYAKAIRQDVNDEYMGFVGITTFPTPINSFTKGMVRSDILTFFTVAEWKATLSWGVTANLLLKRKYINGFHFKSCFPKKGGGEDIDFCLHMKNESKKKLKALPSAQVQHPWWNAGKRSYRRFRRWAFGDSQLPSMHPQHRYYNFPNLVESTTLSFLFGFIYGLITANFIPLFFPLLYILGDFIIEFIRISNNHNVRSIRSTLESIFIRTMNDLGRFWGNLRRFRLKGFCERFDYFCDGLHITNERFYMKCMSCP
jgi:glycosyltransferase involved in cell wall biosynthesis